MITANKLFRKIEISAESYHQGKITLSEAAAKAEITLWEMEQFLIGQGFVSFYSLKDLQEEMRLFAEKKPKSAK